MADSLETHKSNLYSYLKGHKINKGEEYTHTMWGKKASGAYFIPDDEMDTFHELYDRCLYENKKAGEIVIDFKYKALHYMLNPFLEIFIVLLSILSSFLFKFYNPVFICILLMPSAYYFILRSGRYHELESFRTKYRVFGVLMAAAQILRLFTTFKTFFYIYPGFVFSAKIMAVILVISLIVQISLSILNYSKLKN